MSQMKIESPPFLAYFTLFFNFGGWLLVLLTAMFWEWSGMATLGFLYLMLVAPLVTAVAAYNLLGEWRLSGFHKVGFVANITYSALSLILLAAWIFGWQLNW